MVKLVFIAFFISLLSVILLFPIAESKPLTATLSFNLTNTETCTPDIYFVNVWIDSSTAGNSLCSNIPVSNITKNGFVYQSITICQPGDVIFRWKLVQESFQTTSSCTVFVRNITLRTSTNSVVPVQLCPSHTGNQASRSSPIIRIGNESASVLTCDDRFSPKLTIPQYQCHVRGNISYYSHTSPIFQCTPGEILLTGTCYKGQFNG